MWWLSVISSENRHRAALATHVFSLSQYPAAHAFKTTYKETNSSLTLLHTSEPHTGGIINVRRFSISGASTVIKSAK
jgi:hypothetical protein